MSRIGKKPITVPKGVTVQIGADAANAREILAKTA